MTAEQFTYQNYDRPAQTHTEVFERMDAYAKEQAAKFTEYVLNNRLNDLFDGDEKELKPIYDKWKEEQK